MLNKDLKKQKGSPFFLTKNYKKKTETRNLNVSSPTIFK